MKERPILFNTEMVRAILDGKKTQTRRIVKPQPTPCDQVDEDKKPRGGHWWPSNAVQSMVHIEEMLQDSCGVWRGLIDDCNPFGGKGDHLWVRETFRYFDSADECGCSDFPCPCPPNGTPLYKASHATGCDEKWKPSIHMPRNASRLLLEITDIRIERLKSISTDDALSEGIAHKTMNCHRHEFFQLWNSVYGDMAHELNPWVWVVEFKRVTHD